MADSKEYHKRKGLVREYVKSLKPGDIIKLHRCRFAEATCESVCPLTGRINGKLYRIPRSIIAVPHTEEADAEKVVALATAMVQAGIDAAKSNSATPCGFRAFGGMMPPCALPAGHTGEHQDGFGGHYGLGGGFYIEVPAQAATA